MSSNNQFTTRLSQLEELEKSNNYATIVSTLNTSFDSDANDIIKKWMSNETLTNDEEKYLNFYSNLHLSFAKHCLFYDNIKAGIETLIDKLQERLFQRTQINTLGAAVDFIRNQQSNNNNNAHENDPILIYMMKMIDARSLAYRLIKKVDISNGKIDDAVYDCLLHRQAKGYLYYVRSNSDTHRITPISYRHQFFIGCCTFAVALYKGNKGRLKSDPKIDKYICLLVKYVRILLNRRDLIDNKSVHYCLRGILALLTNCISREYWLDIMNKGLTNEDDEDAQKRNPFNLDLFSSIVNNLLASTTFQKETEKIGLNDETLLLDATLVFLVKWSDTQNDVDKDDDDQHANNRSSSLDQPNQLLHCFQSDKQFQHIAQTLVPYIDAKYDRIRLMTLSILTNILNNQEFEELKKQKPHMDKDLIKLIFDFLNQAENQEDHVYKGISFDTLLHYLNRFLVQDFIKRETLPYVSKIVHYAKTPNLYALKILRRIATDPSLKNDLLKNEDLKQFLNTNTDAQYGPDTNISKIIAHIRQSLVSPPKKAKSTVPENGNECQAFISYCHKDKVMCKQVYDKLDETQLFTKIWIDNNYMRDNKFETAAKAITGSKVLFVLLSDHYCQSDFCRREWSYAIDEKIRVYVIFVQQDFDRQKYDWAKFKFAGEIYYKLHREDELQKLIEGLGEFLNKQVVDKPKPPSSSPRPPKSKPTASTGTREYLRKKPVATWTSEDIQDWCSDNHLEKWHKPLTNFDGRILLKIRRDLSSDTRLQLIDKTRDLDIFEVTRFKYEVDKLLSLATTTDQATILSSLTTTRHKPTMKKPVVKRRLSKSLNH